MILRILLVCVIALPALVNAEIYKWKDSEGKVRYSDVPPPSNIKQESLYGRAISGKNTPKPTGLAPLAPVAGDINATINHNKTTTENETAATDARAKRARDAEQQKAADEAKQAELMTKQENCKVARSSLSTYSNGGRIIKTNESGGREYLGDADINQAKLDAQRDVEKYCD